MAPGWHLAHEYVHTDGGCVMYHPLESSSRGRAWKSPLWPSWINSNGIDRGSSSCVLALLSPSPWGRGAWHMLNAHINVNCWGKNSWLKGFWKWLLVWQEVQWSYGQDQCQNVHVCHYLYLKYDIVLPRRSFIQQSLYLISMILQRMLLLPWSFSTSTMGSQNYWNKPNRSCWELVCSHPLPRGTTITGRESAWQSSCPTNAPVVIQHVSFSWQTRASAICTDCMTLCSDDWLLHNAGNYMFCLLH